MKKYLMCLAAAAFAIAACGEKEPQKTETPEISVNPAEISVESAGGTATLQITSNTKWAISTTDAWISFEPASGEGNASVTVTAAENTAYKEREGKLSINSTAKRLTVNVKQAAAEKPEATKLTEIKTAEDFKAFGDAMEQGQYEATETVKLAADISVTEPIDKLLCIFDGQDHTITFNYEDKTGYSVDDPKAEGDPAGALLSNVGLFRLVYAPVKNLKTAGTITSSTPDNTDFTYHIGGIAGYARATASFENCTNGIKLLATAFNTQHMGGIAGYTEEGVTVKGCTNKGSVGMTYSGSSKASQLGGIVGHVEGVANFESCVNDGEISYIGGGTCRIGGIVGYINNVTSALFKDCTNNGAVKNDATGYTAEKWAYAGGITGYYGTPIEACQVLYDGCVNNGTVSSNTGGTKLRTRLGGIAALAGNANGKFEYKNCTNNGSITQTNGNNSAARAQLAGIVAYAEKAATVAIDGCTSNGPITTDAADVANVGVSGIIGGGAKASAATITNVTVTSKTVLTFLAGTSAGLIGGANEAYVSAITGKVAGSFSADGNVTVATAENFAKMLFGRALGEGATITGVTFGE